MRHDTFRRYVQGRTVPVIMTLIAMLLTGCSAGGAEEKNAPTQNAVELTKADAVWAVYWDQEGASEILAQIREGIPKVCLFGATFDQERRPVVHEDTKELAEELEETGGQEQYLTFVNDLLLQKGSSLKDADLLYDLIGTDEQAKRHAEEITEMAAQLGCDGIEIDYEQIRDDLELWRHFQTFLEYLLQQAEMKGLSVRVLLEPGTPLEEITLPDGPEYVVMCYNLYGPGTQPGPKADRDFLLQMAEKFSVLPDVSYALANGGFCWNEQDGSVQSITTQDARILAAELGISPVRNSENGALSFRYLENETPYTIWYGDGETLEHWRGILEEAAGGPVQVSIWRLGG